MRVKNWDLRELRERIAEGYSLRIFTEFYSQPVPRDYAFHRSFNRLTLAPFRLPYPVESLELGSERALRVPMKKEKSNQDIHPS